MTHAADSDLHYWLCLHQAGAGLHSILLNLLPFVDKLSDLQAWSGRALKEVGLSEAQIKQSLEPNSKGVQPVLEWLHEAEHNHVIPYADPRYPALLKHIPDPPFVLYLKGNPEALNHRQIAIVGARKASYSGCQLAFDWAMGLSRAGFTVTSGLALGIDGQAHRGALAAQGVTVAVVGTSPDIDYPHKNRGIVKELLELGGAVVSEFWPTTPPLPFNFPKRNRIISGLSQGVLVVEAALRSGSLITARMAVEQNRDVFAIPGNAVNPMARGTNHLIKQGAKLVDSLEDILEEYESPLRLHKSFKVTGQDEVLCAHLSKEEVDILNAIEDHLTGVEAIVSHTGLSAQTVSSRLVELQFQGLIKAMPGGYIRARRAQNERECA